MNTLGLAIVQAIAAAVFALLAAGCGGRGSPGGCGRRRLLHDCRHIPLPSRQGYTITPADRTDYLEAAACMRSHGFPDFPDPAFQNNNVQLNIPSSIDTNSARFKSAAATCTKLIPAGLPYSKSSGS